jgi:hypothetical protein
MERSDFLKKAGIGTFALGSLGAFADAAWAGDDHPDARRFYFTALSGQAATLTGGDAIAMAGCGSFRHSSADGGGEFVHFNGMTIPSSSFIGTGSWKVTRLISFEEVGTWGVAVSGIAVLGIKLLPCDGHALHATLEIVCNLGPAGLSTGKTEGYTLTIPGLTPFQPFSPNIGLTLFTRHCPDDED